VLMDLHVPLMDGFETTRYIRNNLRLPIPIIAMTANLMHEEETKCVEAGMNGFISKPYTAETLLCVLSKYISLNDHFAEKDKIPLAPVESALYDLSVLADASNGSRTVLQQMILAFIDQVTVAVNELKTAYHNHNFPGMYGIAHNIKPTIDTLNIVSVKEIIGQIECYAERKEHSSVLKDLIENLDDGVSKVVQQLKVNVLLH